MEVKKIREKTKLSQSEFAKKFNIPIKTLQKWEQHDSDPLPYLISLIQEDIDVEEFIDVTKYMIKPSNSFKVTRKRRFKNIEHVHPIQQENIEKILDCLKKFDEVNKVILFGSSVTSKCTYDSDIDIYVELDKDINVKTYNISTPVDFWSNFTVHPNMLEEIKKTGVVIYDRR